jgi:hypothetical protein
MSNFCTSCGTANSGVGFCTTCGAALAASLTLPTVSTVTASVPELLWSEDGPLLAGVGGSKSPKKKFLLVGVFTVIFFGTGVGAFFAGKSSIDLEKERKTSYDSGSRVGDSAGYGRGLRQGKIDGCEWVFEQADYASYVTKYNLYGYGYGRYPGSVYISKTSC